MPNQNELESVSHSPVTGSVIIEEVTFFINKALFLVFSEKMKFRIREAIREGRVGAIGCGYRKTVAIKNEEAKRIMHALAIKGLICVRAFILSENFTF